jgi:hypothetical protein
MSVLIIGSPEEAHAAFMYDKLSRKGGEPVYFDTRRFPECLRLSVNVGPGADWDCDLGRFRDGDGVEVPLDAVRAVYWRYHMGLALPDVADDFLRHMAHREIESTLGSLFRMLPCRWVNSPHAVARHVYKVHQLHQLYQRGIRVPRTLVTNDPQAVRMFYDALDGRVIYKPVRGGAHTQALRPEDLHEERLAQLSKAPVQFQEWVDGVDVRLYLIKDEVFAAEIRSRTLDFRDDPRAPIVPVAVPESVAADCRIVAETLGLLYSGIDARRTPDGEYVFLEANPCPMFIHFERQTGYPISDRLVDLLLFG